MTKKLRGFAVVKQNNPERLIEICRKGGASVAIENRSFSRNNSLAISAGRKGGLASKKEAAAA